jgi:hypothetical protein
MTPIHQCRVSSEGFAASSAAAMVAQGGLGAGHIIQVRIRCYAHSDPWTVEQAKLVKTLPAEEASRRTGRSLQAVYARRSRLQLPDGRRRT